LGDRIWWPSRLSKHAAERRAASARGQFGNPNAAGIETGD
jgi:hypothetical protein